MTKQLSLIALFLMITAVFSACIVEQADIDSLVVSRAWVRPADETSAAYLQITNNSRSPQQLVGVDTAAAHTAEIHETQMDGDIMRMRPVAAIEIPAGETVHLEPGGTHVMLMGLTSPLIVGQAIPLKLMFGSGASLEVEAVVSAEPAAADELTTAALTAVSEGHFVGDVTNPPVTVQDFAAPSTRPDVARLSDLNGRWRVIFFGYMHCPDFCPLTLADYKNAKAALGEAAAKEVEFVFISVDADRDSIGLMQPYLANFDPDFVGFATDDKTLARIQPDYGFYYERRMESGSDAVYTIDHSTRSYLLDREGILRTTFTYDTTPELIAEALQWHLAHE